jgi:pectate lyase
VTVSNLVGITNSVFAMLTVTNNTQPPGILTQPTNLTVFVGQTANFGVAANGALPLHYQWYYNTNTLLAGKTNNTLTLTNVQLTNAGTYSVTITNLFGTTNSAFATLTVNSNVNSQLIGWAAVAGYGQATTTGGGTNAPILVTDIATLRTLAGDSTPRVLHLSGTFVTGSSAITIGNNKTLRGVGPNVVIQGGININTKSNIIVQNLHIQGNGAGAAPADTAAARTSHHLWFDHVSFSDAGDGLLDLTVASDLITVSWCKFFYTDPNNSHRLASLVGNSSNSTGDLGHNRVTYHHNWFAELVDQRMPRLLFGKGHMFNNYYNSPGNGYCIGTGSWGSALVENNYFKQVNSPHQSQDGNPSYIAASGNVYDNTTGNKHTGLLNPDNDGNDPGPWIPPYSYALDPAANVPSMVTAGAGPQ